MEIPSLLLNDDTKMPAVGFGCYKVGVVPASATGGSGGSAPRSALEVITDALSVGYRCFDCAQFYDNEADVGSALKAGGVPREELYLISKVWTNRIFEGPEAVKAQCKQTLSDLRCEYIDCYMIHWPVPGKHVAAYKALLELQADGIIKSVGVSNYTVEDLKELQDAGLRLPVVNQIEINPFLFRKETIDYCRSLNIQLQAYRALCNSKAWSEPVILELATKHQRSSAQILGRWAVQKGFQHIPKSENRDRMEVNAALFDFVLDDDDLKKLDVLTTEQSLEAFKALYQKCVLRDTPLNGTMQGVRTDFTVC